MTKRTKGNAKHLFKEDIKDGWLRKIPELGDFGNRNIPSLGISGLHIGTDYGADVGEEVIAYDDYVVLSTSGHSDYGNQVFLYFPKIDKTGHYAHLDSISVNDGQSGKARDVIGTSGNTGKSQGSHLHFSFGSGKITNTNKGNSWEDFEKYVYPKQSSGNKYINIHKGEKYGTYAMNVAPVRKNISQWLRPDNLGGLSYEIKETTKDPNVFIIETRDFGKRQIFLDKSRASLTDKPLYKVYGKESGSVAPSATKPQAPKPKPSLVGKQVKLGGMTRLFHNSSGSTTYPYNSINKKTDLRTRNVPVIEESNNRVKVRISGFNPELIWIDKEELR